nr:MAG TPA: hypothetical protein [Caudoviricetes sp.]
MRYIFKRSETIKTIKSGVTECASHSDASKYLSG